MLLAWRPPAAAALETDACAGDLHELALDDVAVGGAHGAPPRESGDHAPDGGRAEAVALAVEVAALLETLGDGAEGPPLLRGFLGGT